MSPTSYRLLYPATVFIALSYRLLYPATVFIALFGDSIMIIHFRRAVVKEITGIF